jgi:hypothetical protein
MSHLQFQNGYHQYEIFDYIGIPAPWCLAAQSVASIADFEGRFAPYPGGGGCFDYDAVFFLTSNANIASSHRPLLQVTAESILRDQNPDGGFCESKYVRPRSVHNVRRSLNHAFNVGGAARLERLRWALTTLRPKHDRIQTHWSEYRRGWGESDLWDSWFRMLTLARIESSLVPDRASNWGFIDFVGIGFYSEKK